MFYDSEDDLYDEDMDVVLDDALHNEDEDLLDDEGYYVAMFLRRIIANGTTHFTSNHICPSLLPKIKSKPVLDILKKNSIYQTVTNGSGFRIGEKTNEQPWSVVKMLQNREVGITARKGGFTQSERCKLHNQFLPNQNRTLVELETKIYCGKFSKNGNYFVTASQDHILRVFDSSTPDYNVINEIPAKDVGWGILDIAFSPEGEHFVYSTWSMCLYLSRINGDSNEVQCLNLEPNSQRFCIFSVAFSNCGKQIIGGSSDGCLYIYDRASSVRTRLNLTSTYTPDEKKDVNTVGFIDETSNIIYTGIDDGCIKIWDRRCLNETEPVGKLIGHIDGVTYIDPKNDGRYLISNSKDQSIKLWDLRVFSKSGAEQSAYEFRESYRDIYQWDYRWDKVPKEFYSDTFKMDADTSIMTYRGHCVNKSLIRAKFSPLETTGQRYIYTGCGTGRLVIYDVLTGDLVQIIEGHKDIVRDVDWHPSRSEILSSSFDFTVKLNTYQKNPDPKTTKKANKKNQTDQSMIAPRRSQRIAAQRAQLEMDDD